ncbi:hypothetical protein GCM10010254_13040 [Streptomyces chromofuscus]|nr:hypothetical protein GCM10010254_13040 [Streptomyces chromofuscus]
MAETHRRSSTLVPRGPAPTRATETGPGADPVEEERDEPSGAPCAEVPGKAPGTGESGTEDSGMEGSGVDSAVGADKAVTPGHVGGRGAADRPWEADGPPHHAVGDTRSQRGSLRSQLHLMRW